MTLRCCNCDYKMRTNQEIQSAIVKAGFDLKDFIALLGLLGVAGVYAVHLNTGPNAIKCPKCGEIGRFEDV